MGKVRDLTEKRKIDIENESAKLTEELEAISSIVGKLKLQGDTLVEKVQSVKYNHVLLRQRYALSYTYCVSVHLI